MTPRSSVLVAFGLGLVAVGAWTPAVEASHGHWWRGFGTASLGPLALDLDFVWGGVDIVIECGGGGCRGQGDGWMQLSKNGLKLPPTVYQATEDTRNIRFAATPDCPTLEIVDPYSLTGPDMDLRGRAEHCLANFPVGHNHVVLDGTIGAFAAHIESGGGFWPGVPPPGAPPNQCCHG